MFNKIVNKKCCGMLCEFVDDLVCRVLVVSGSDCFFAPVYRKTSKGMIKCKLSYSAFRSAFYRDRLYVHIFDSSGSSQWYSLSERMFYL